FNLSLAYWSPAGLETAAFAFSILLSVYLYLKKSWGLMAALAAAVWLRPEGALLAGLLVIVEVILKRQVPKYSLYCVLGALVLSLPMVLFKLFYYGSILPNPFYAKTGFNTAQIFDGLEYAGRFLKHYGFYGAGFLAPLLFFKRLSAKIQTLWLLTVLYTVYIVLVGGDVLKVHRFFIPMVGPYGILITVTVFLMVNNLKNWLKYAVFIIISLGLMGLTYYLPHDFVHQYNTTEKLFTKKLAFQAQELKKSDQRNFSVAISTIGIFGYELLGHDIIDMLGLTDTTIARHSEEPIAGMETTWKERKHNSRYLLERAPDYIMFSTGVKPSAPAERALLLYPQFLNAYRSLGWFYPGDRTDGKGVVVNTFKKVRPVEGEIIPTYPIAYVQYYKEGMDAYVRRDYRTAIQYFDRALAVSPQPYNGNLVYSKANCHLMLGEHDTARTLMNQLVEQDSLLYLPHKDLYMYDMVDGDTARALIHRRWLEKLVPWYLPRIDTLVVRTVRLQEQPGRKL
ncbi:MAG: tetratricopeptide repeat protein, partial [Candidatus Zixiibacteriota bacterium]